MPSIKAISATLLALLAVSDAAILRMTEGGTPSGCTGSRGCCIPSCDVEVEDSLGASGVVRWAGTCSQNFEKPDGTLDVAKTGHQMTWLKQEDGQVVIDVYRKSDKKYDRWAVSNCKAPNSSGGSQCAPSGGGCDLTQLLLSAQG